MSLQHILEIFLGWCVQCAFLRERPVVIGVAGSVGKSSTKTAIGVALEAGEKGSGVVASEKNFNNELGVPLTVFGYDAPHRNPLTWISLLFTAFITALGLKSLRAHTFILELATDKPGDLAYLMTIVRPTIAVLTAIGPEHTEFFGTIDEVAKEESVIITALDPESVAIVNSDDTRIRNVMNAFSGKQLTFGVSEASTVRINATKMVMDGNELAGLSVQIYMYGKMCTLYLQKTVGRPHTFAAAAAIAVACALDQDERDVCQRLTEKFHGLQGRMRLIEGIKHTWIIDDTYNSSPLAVLSAIRDLASIPLAQDAKRIAVLGDMLELGALAESAHQEMGRAVAESRIDTLVVCGTLAHIVAQSAIDAGMLSSSVHVFPDSVSAGLFVQQILREHDIVLVKGSQGIRMERIVKEIMAHPEKAEQELVRHSPDWLAR